MRQVKKYLGFSLLELLISLTIGSIMMAIAIPSYSSFIDHQRRLNAQQAIISNVFLARSLAIETKQQVVICGSADGHACNNDWNSGSLTFIDTNSNRYFDDKDTAVNFSPWQHTLKREWRAAFGSKVFRALPSGSVSYTGSFITCDKEGNTSVISISRTGRPRALPDKNNDGHPENSSGKPVTCRN